MKRTLSPRSLAAFALLGVVASPDAQGLGSRFCLRGRFVTDDVIVRNGEMYVPVSALARSLGLAVRANGGVCDLVSKEAGYRVTILDVARVTSYRNQFGTHDFSVDAAPGRDLLVVTLRLFNDTGVPQSPDLVGGRDTRVRDAAFRAYAPLKGPTGQVVNGRASVFAGRSVDFALKFDVPKEFRPEALTFSVQSSAFEEPVDFQLPLGHRRR